jgi:peptide methionine sulfoxide reductase MsrA
MMAATANVTGYKRFSGENLLKSTVANIGPVSVYVHVNDKFRQYKRGVFYDEKCPKNFNHAVSRMNENIFLLYFKTF